LIRFSGIDIYVKAAILPLTTRNTHKIFLGDGSK